MPGPLLGGWIGAVSGLLTGDIQEQIDRFVFEKFVPELPDGIG